MRQICLPVRQASDRAIQYLGTRMPHNNIPGPVSYHGAFTTAANQARPHERPFMCLSDLSSIWCGNYPDYTYIMINTNLTPGMTAYSIKMGPFLRCRRGHPQWSMTAAREAGVLEIESWAKAGNISEDMKLSIFAPLQRPVYDSSVTDKMMDIFNLCVLN